MQPSQWQAAGQLTGTTQLSPAARKMLRNTYLLLAISMVPTILGAWLGVSLGFRMSLWTGLLLFFGVSFISFYFIQRYRHSSLGVEILLAFTGFMGLWLSQLLQFALSFSNGIQLITLAAGGTGVIFASFAAIATVSKRDFSFLGNILYAGLWVVIIAAVANFFLRIPLVELVILSVALLIFSGYVLYDVQRIVRGGEDSYVTATLSLYLDVYGLFVNLLRILIAIFGNRD